jgi:hypothetical protein
MNGLRKCGVHNTMDYYSVMMNNEIMSFPGKWMKLDSIMSSEVSQLRKTRSNVFPHMWKVDL